MDYLKPVVRSGDILAVGCTLLAAFLVFVLETVISTSLDTDYSFLLLLAIPLALTILVAVSVYVLVHRRLTGIVPLLGAILMLSWIGLSCGPGGNRMVRTVAPDGTELCLVQTYNGYWSEPYMISFFVRRPGSEWSRYYVGHEELRWWFPRLRISEGGTKVELIRFLLPVGSYYLKNHQLSIAQLEAGAPRSPITTMPLDWKPGHELRR